MPLWFYNFRDHKCEKKKNPLYIVTWLSTVSNESSTLKICFVIVLKDGVTWHITNSLSLLSTDNTDFSKVERTLS